MTRPLVATTSAATPTSSTDVAPVVSTSTVPASTTVAVAPAPPQTTSAPSSEAPTVPPTVPPMTTDEINAVLGPVVVAWAAAPSGPGYDAIAAAARSLLESGRPISDNPGRPSGETARLLAGLLTYPGSDTDVVDLLRALEPAVPAVTLAPPRTTTAPPVVEEPTDPRFSSCKEAKAHGYGPYRRGSTEYNWYDDRDDDGVVCE